MKNVSYEVRPVTRFEIVRSESSENYGSVATVGEYGTQEMADRVAALLSSAEQS